MLFVLVVVVRSFLGLRGIGLEVDLLGRLGGLVDVVVDCIGGLLFVGCRLRVLFCSLVALDSRVSLVLRGPFLGVLHLLLVWRRSLVILYSCFVLACRVVGRVCLVVLRYVRWFVVFGGLLRGCLWSSSIYRFVGLLVVLLERRCVVVFYSWRRIGLGCSVGCSLVKLLLLGSE